MENAGTRPRGAQCSEVRARRGLVAPLPVAPLGHGHVAPVLARLPVRLGRGLGAPPRAPARPPARARARIRPRPRAPALFGDSLALERRVAAVRRAGAGLLLAPAAAGASPGALLLRSLSVCALGSPLSGAAASSASAASASASAVSASASGTWMRAREAAAAAAATFLLGRGVSTCSSDAVTSASPVGSPSAASSPSAATPSAGFFLRRRPPREPRRVRLRAWRAAVGGLRIELLPPPRRPRPPGLGLGLRLRCRLDLVVRELRAGARASASPPRSRP